MDDTTLGIISLALTVVIASATIWIAFTANRISQRQFEMDLHKQKLEWCRSCLQSISQAVSLASFSQNEITDEGFQRRRRELRGMIISLKNEGELFLVPKDGRVKDVPSLQALRMCYKSMDGDIFKPPTAYSSADLDGVRPQILNSLKEFRKAMQKDFGDAWSKHF